MSKNHIGTIAIGFAALSIAAPLQAQETPDLLVEASPDARVRIVDFNDLDISQAQDMERLRSRVAVAVNWACPARIQGPINIYPDHSECRAKAWSEADRQIADAAARIAMGKAAPTRLAVMVSAGSKSAK
ncbi:UrcA family protein [Qipengyuania sp. 1XM1-15A]|uniref:UrcA family protein n=1 Tax=Qipengyuania xiamenensis TaxID=2867237 RepID=UPI001C868FE2|nr:UrcA family protein [Qipengyuania xiamenensis]MBX7532919.1 UrcA family protein [Qipengyuania xiamenensis]